MSRTKRMVSIPTKMCKNTLHQVLVDEFGEGSGDKMIESIVQWFEDNPKKTCMHIHNLRMKVRKWPVGEYTIEEA